MNYAFMTLKAGNCICMDHRSNTEAPDPEVKDLISNKLTSQYDEKSKADFTVGKLMCKKINVSKATAFRLHDVGMNFSISCKHLQKKAVLLEILIFMYQFPHCDISFAFRGKCRGK